MARRFHPLAGAALALWFVAIFAPAHAESKHAAAPPLTIDRLYSLPWVIGTSPIAPTWSPDSRRVAFLWNEDGGNFRDVWVLTAQGSQPVRVTAMRRPVLPAAPGKDVAQLEQVERAEIDPGVSAVRFAPDGKHLVFVFTARSTRCCRAASRRIWQHLRAPPATWRSRCARRRRPSSRAAPCGAYPCRQRARPSRVYDAGRPDVAVESFVWSPDGRRLAFIEADETGVPERGIPDYLQAETQLKMVKRAFPGEPSAARRVGIVTPGSVAVRWLDLGPDLLDEIFGLAWSPDGRTLLVDKSDLYIKQRRLLLVDTSTFAVRELLRETEPHNVTAEWWSDWSPDGRGVFFTSDRDTDYHVYFQPLAGGTPTRITRGTFAVFDAWVSAAAKALFVMTNQDRAEERQLYRVPLQGGTLARVTVARGTHKPVLSPDGRQLADLFSDDVTPPDLYLQSSGAVATSHRVTQSPVEGFRDYPWIAARYVTFPNVNDGTLLHARLTLPKDFDPARKYPAILGSVYSNTAHNEWGGRVYHPTWGIDQFLAQQGYVIMNVDITGSSGYGKLFRQRIREDYGGVDVEDLASGVQYLVAQGFVDKDRVGIWGSSYGGLLTTTSLFAKPQLYRAGVAGAPATSLYHAQTGEMRTMMAPQDHAQQYAQSSAFLKSAGLAGHLMIIHGMQDDVVLFKDSVVLQQRLILQGGDVDLVPLPNAPHGWDTQGLAQARFAFHKLFDHFERYLKGPLP